MNGYAYEFINGRTDSTTTNPRDGGHFRIHDKRDNAVGFCYSEFNARLLVDALNNLVQPDTALPEGLRDLLLRARAYVPHTSQLYGEIHRALSPMDRLPTSEEKP